MTSGDRPTVRDGEPIGEPVDEGRPPEDLPVRDLREDVVGDQPPADALDRLSQSLTRVADELTRGTQQIEAVAPARRAKRSQAKTPAPEASAPEVSEPEVSEPEVSEPEVSEPEVSEPQVSEPVVVASAAGGETVDATTPLDSIESAATAAADQGSDDHSSEPAIQASPEHPQEREPTPLPESRSLQFAPTPDQVDQVDQVAVAATTTSDDTPSLAAASEVAAPIVIEPVTGDSIPSVPSVLASDTSDIDEPAPPVADSPPATFSPPESVKFPEAFRGPEALKVSEVIKAPEVSKTPEVDEFIFPVNSVEEPTTSDAAEPAAGAPVPGRGPRTLSKGRYAAVVAFAEALLPPGGDLPPSASAAGVADRIDDAVGRMEPAVRRRIMRLIGFVDSAPIATRGRKLSKMPRDTATGWIERALNARSGKVRDAVTTLKSIAGNEFASTALIEQAVEFTYACETSSAVQDAPPLEIISFPEISRDHVEDCDVVIVGSGAGGSAAAKELSEAGLAVIVVEEGGSYARADFAGPPWERLQKLARQNALLVADGPPAVPIIAGKAVGGSTMIGTGTAFRTPDEVLERWGSEHGIDGIDPATMRPIFERVERILHVQQPAPEILGEHARVFQRGVNELALSGRAVKRTIVGCRGCGVCTFGCPSDALQTAAVSYLPRAQRSGATIFARCGVRRIIVEQGRARGVVADILDDHGRRRATLTVRARMVVLAAGALHTPSLLAANALGNRSGMLGRNLRLHPSITMGGLFDEPVYSWRGTQQPYAVDSADGRTMVQVMAAVPGTTAGRLPGAGMRYKTLIGRLPNVVGATVTVADGPGGRIRGRRDGEPRIAYRLGDDDAALLGTGMVRVAEILMAAGARAVSTGLAHLPWVTGDEEMAALRQERLRGSDLRPAGTAAAGTARMGSDPSTTVTDPWGEVRDLEGLFIADASVLPESVPVPPLITVTAFATRTAAHIIRSRSADLL